MKGINGEKKEKDKIEEITTKVCGCILSVKAEKETTS